MTSFVGYNNLFGIIRLQPNIKCHVNSFNFLDQSYLLEFATTQGNKHDTIRTFGPEYKVSVEAKMTEILGSIGNLFRLSSEDRGFGIYQKGGSKNFIIYYYANGGSKKEFIIPFNFNQWYKLTISQTLLAGKVSYNFFCVFFVILF